MAFKLYETDESKGLFWSEKTDIQNSVDCMRLVCIHPDFKYQTIKGFGGAFTESSGYNLTKVSENVKEDILKAYFSEDGLKYNLGRVHINSCDFGLGNYAYMDDPKDTEMNSYDISREREYVLPMIQRAREIAAEDIIVLASPWSPPAFMKTNGEMNHGGKLKPEFYEFWARYMARYVKEFRALGVDIRMISVQNEPQAVQTWDSCIYDTEEEMVFVRDYLGPVLEEEGLSDVGIFIWDHNKEILFERADGVLRDPKASKYVKGVAFHWYGGDHFESIGLVNQKYPDKELMFTEGCVEYSRFADSNEVAKAEMYAHDMLGNFLAGTNGYLDWNLLLDELGGPNHVSNFCAAPIMCDTKAGTMEKRLSYFYIGHFSRYIRRGAVRVATTRFTDKVEAVAFENPDGSIVTVLLNRTGENIWMSLRNKDEGISFVLNAHSIVTVINE